MGYLIIQTSTDSLSTAKTIAKEIVDTNLSPCVHIINAPNVIYKWEGKTISTKEYIIQVKSNDILKKKTISIIKKLHNYNNPELFSKKINLESDEYEKWFIKEMGF